MLLYDQRWIHWSATVQQVRVVMERRENELVSVREATEFLGLSVSTVRRHVRDRRLSAYRVAGARVLCIRRDHRESLLSRVAEEDNGGGADH